MRLKVCLFCLLQYLQHLKQWLGPTRHSVNIGCLPKGVNEWVMRLKHRGEEHTQSHRASYWDSKMKNLPYHPSNIVIHFLNSLGRGERTSICSAPFQGQPQFGCVYSQHLIIICESPTIYTQYQEVSIITFILQMGKQRHRYLSYVLMITKLLSGRQPSSA